MLDFWLAAILLVVVVGVFLYHAAGSVEIYPEPQQKWVIKEVAGRPGYVQVFVDGNPGCVFPKEPLDWPAPDV